MTRRRKDPLRTLTSPERSHLEGLSRSQAEPASQVARAKILLAVAEGHTYHQAAQAAGRRSYEAVSALVSRFNQEGLAALVPRHGGGPPVLYGPTERERILTEFRRPPDRDTDGTARWSLSTLQQALQSAPDGLAHVSVDTLWQVVRGAGFTCQRDGSWCETGTAVRVRKSGTVTVVDPDAEAKKN